MKTRNTNLGGIGFMVSQKRLQTGFWITAIGYLVFFYFTARPPSFEALLGALGLVVIAFIPSFLWCTGRAKGLPILPIFALTFIPAYALPVQTSSRVLRAYSAEQQAKGVLIIALFLGLITLIWHQTCNRSIEPRRFTYAIDSRFSARWLLGFMIVYLCFSVFGQELIGDRMGLRALLAGIFRNASSVAVFIFSYQLGKKELNSGLKLSFIILLSALTLVDSTSLILIGGIGRLALAVGGYALGGGKIPWKILAVLAPLIWVLHAGKGQMREEFWKEGKTGATQAKISDYPKLFKRWLELGLQKSFSPNDNDGGSTAAERGVLLDVFLRIHSMTPSQKPFLMGATYEELPKMLIPRFLSKEKSPSHIGNIILAYVYEYISAENLLDVSIQFDLMIEAYANYGYLGIFGMAVILGLLLGITSVLAVQVPLLSFRFLFAILLLNTFLGAYNTAGVFVTTLWQGTIGLAGLSILMMRKLPNPFYGEKEISGNKIKMENREFEKKIMIESCENKNYLNSQSSSLNPETKPKEGYERPTRFVYKKRNKS